MGAYYGAEIAVNLIQAQIQATIANNLANVRTSRNDPIVSTEPPREYFIYANANIYRPPAVFTLFENQMIKNTASDGNFINAVDSIVVVCVIEDRLERLLTIKAWRYQAALMQSLHLVTLTNSDGGVRLFSKVNSAEFSAILPHKMKDETQVFRKEIGLRLSVDHIENLE
jgi:hypothetical protein